MYWCKPREPLWSNHDLDPCFRESIIEGLIPLVYIAVTILVITLRWIWISGCFGICTPASAGYMPLATDETHSQTSTIVSAEDEEEEGEEENEVQEEPNTQQAPRRLSFAATKPYSLFRDSLRFFLSIGVLSINLALFLTRRDSTSHEQEYKLIGPLAEIIVWSFATVASIFHMFRSQRWIISFSPALSGLFLLYFPIAYLRLRSLAYHPTTQPELVLAGFNFAFSCILAYLAFTSQKSDRQLPKSPLGRPPNPEAIVSISSRMLFSWLNPMLSLGMKKPLDEKDVWDLRSDDKAKPVSKSFKHIKRRKSLTTTILVHFWPQLSSQVFWSFTNSTVKAVGPYFLKQILFYLENRKSNTPEFAFWCAVGLLASMCFSSMAQSQALFIGRRICIRLRAVIVSEIYDKALRRRDLAGSMQNSAAPSIASRQGDGQGATSSKNVGRPQEEEEDKATHGMIVNMMSVDSFSISEICSYLHTVYEIPILIVVIVVFLYKLLGWSALAGVLVLFLLMPINYYSTVLYQNMENALLKAADKRLNLMNELLQGIRTIKFFAWESQFMERVEATRQAEITQLYVRLRIFAFWEALYWGTPAFVTLSTFLCYTKIAGHELTASTLFTALALFNMLRDPLNMLPSVVADIVRAKVSLDRVNGFLQEEETEKYRQLRRPLDLAKDPAIGFRDATFRWGGDKEIAASPSGAKGLFELRDLNIEFPVGELTLVIGPTGAGKTSLIMALLGEMNVVKGETFLPDKSTPPHPKMSPGYHSGIAYVAQSAWLQNSTIRDNILFGQPFEQDRYDRVVEACALKRDLEILEAGDQTEIGEKGITLSGGQKQRVSLARAVYSRAGHVLMDDCLSAVDAHTAKWIYENCLQGELMKGRTCILVTHAVGLCLPGARKIVVVNNGRVVANGTAEELLDAGVLSEDILLERQNLEEDSVPTPDEVTAEEILAGGKDAAQQDQLEKQQMKGKDVQAAHTASSSTTSVNTNVDTKTGNGRLIQEEERAKGKVKWSVYVNYFRAVGGPGFWVFMLSLLAFTQVCYFAQDYWLKLWAQAYNSPVGQAFVNTLSTLAFVIPPAMYFGVEPDWTAKASAYLGDYGSSDAHVSNIADQEVDVDYYLKVYLGISLMSISLYTIRYILLAWGAVYASRILHHRLLVRVMNAPLRFFDTTPIGRIVNRFSKDMQTIDQEVMNGIGIFLVEIAACITVLAVIITITPSFLIFALGILFSYVMVCMYYLRTSRELKRIESVTRSPIFSHFGETLMGVTTIRAYGMEHRFRAENLNRIDATNRPFFYLWAANRWLSIRTDILGAAIAFIAAIVILFGFDSFDPGLAGLSLSYSITFTDHALWLMRFYSQNEINMNSCERLEEYLSIEQEPAAVVEGNRPPADWPHRGEVVVKDLVLRYAPENPPVLRGLTFRIEGGEKVAVVGRTGAGKSTLASAFFRFMEFEGSICIDGIDISKIGLRDLRSSLTIIPQDPVLFMGTVRNNLDPFGEHTDAALYTALRRVHLIGATSEEDAADNDSAINPFTNLESPVSEQGVNLSQGQRQLVGLARALLRQNRVIILDEATASVDHETDARIQRTIREEFTAATLICIAHRLRTIIDYDRVFVMDHGHIVEVGSPRELIHNESGVFRSMCERSGEMEVLLDMIGRKAESS
ncbi:uncharacterized protein VTP21DRAFT_437 [Calcarisporiella thermophila]|uniref:uncharacterized protein n=1 Tax=Calcarisporiella thermophila TaxID=911321 RepID=UPI003743C3E6